MVIPIEQIFFESENLAQVGDKVYLKTWIEFDNESDYKSKKEDAEKDGCLFLSKALKTNSFLVFKLLDK